jgi:hypothetical protein
MALRVGDDISVYRRQFNRYGYLPYRAGKA